MNATRTPDKGPHDMGGDSGGPIDTADHGMKFWEKQANGMRMSIVKNRVLTLDELRRAAEDLGDQYYDLAYFERTTTAIRNVLMERGIITPDELAAKMAEIRARFEVPDEMESALKKDISS